MIAMPQVTIVAESTACTDTDTLRTRANKQSAITKSDQVYAPAPIQVMGISCCGDPGSRRQPHADMPAEGKLAWLDPEFHHSVATLQMDSTVDSRQLE